MVDGWEVDFLEAELFKSLEEYEFLIEVVEGFLGFVCGLVPGFFLLLEF